MKPQYRNTLILVLVLAAGLVGWWLLETVKSGQTPAETPGAGTYLFPLLSLDNVESVEVKLRSGPSVVAFKGTDGWVLGGMGGERLDDDAVNGGVQSLVELQAQRTFTENVSLAEYGLDVPTATIKLTVARENPESLLVGRMNPQSTAYYVQKAGKPAVYLVSRYAIDAALGWASKPPRMPTPVLMTVVATLTPVRPTMPVTATVIVIPTPLPSPTATPPPAVTVVTVVVTPTPVQPTRTTSVQPTPTMPVPSATPTPTVKPTVAITPAQPTRTSPPATTRP
jgi:hypothetical protein